MKKLIFLIIIPVIFMQSYAAEVYDMSDLADPHLFTVDKDDIYISERSKIYIYKYPDKLVRVFGKKGEGPGEFREYFDQGLMITPFRGDLCVESNGRVSYFKKDGTFINEIKTGSGHMHTPVGNNFVALRWGVIDNFAYNRIILKNSNMHLVKVLQMKKNWYQEGRDINKQELYPRIRFANNRIYQLLEDMDEEAWQLHITDIPSK